MFQTGGETPDERRLGRGRSIGVKISASRQRRREVSVGVYRDLEMADQE